MNMTNAIMITVDHISKQYVLGQIGGTTLREELQRFSARVRKREDPTKPVNYCNYDQTKTFLALNDVSFDVEKGDRLGIIGHNGAGKSTLLKLISRVTAPTSGMIGLNGRVASMLEVGTGFHPELTGRENIFMNGAILGMTRREIAKKMDDIIDFSECRKFIDTPVKRYSSGMYVKLAFSVATHLDSEIMIMDEVLAVGDVAFQRKCLEKMKDVSDTQGRTILYVSHNMNTIRQLCNRCIVLDHGKKIFDGETEKGISIYLQSAYSETRTYVDFSYRKRNHWSQIGEDATLISLKLLEKDHARYEFQEPVIMGVTVKAYVKIEHISFRLELISNDGSFIGTALGEDVGTLEKEQTGTFILSLPTKNIVPGNYSATIVIYQNNSYKASNDLDYVERAFSFEIIDTDHHMPIAWKNDKWGHILLDNISLSDTPHQTDGSAETEFPV